MKPKQLVIKEMKTMSLQQIGKKRDKILFKRYQYRGGSEYVDIIMSMEDYAELRIKQFIKEHQIILK